MVKFCIDKVLFNYIWLALIFQSHGHWASILNLDFKLFLLRHNLLGKNIGSKLIDIPIFTFESCELKDFIADKFEKGHGTPSLDNNNSLTGPICPPDFCDLFTNWLPQTCEEELVKKLGYPIEKYIVETGDGYLLTLFRIEHGKNKEGPELTRRKPVLLQHGLLDSSAVFLATATSMAYYLADRGYDVWVGNSRGTTLSRRHKDEERRPDKKGTTFWEYSFHEMGVYDLPAVLGKIREETGDQRIHYVGMSMGTTQFLVMASEIVSSQDWVDCVVLMAPVARPKHMGMGSGFAYFFSWSYFNALRALTNGESCIHRAKLARAVYKFCISKRENICKVIMKNISKPNYGDNQYDFDNTVTTYLYSPAGASVMTFVHYLQIVSSGKFQQFDYGKAKNKKQKYGTKKPPQYNLKNINKKLFLMVGGADDVATEVDVKWLQRQLPSSELIIDGFNLFTHRDFHHSVDIDLVLYNKILDIFTNWESGKDHFR